MASSAESKVCGTIVGEKPIYVETIVSDEPIYPDTSVSDESMYADTSVSDESMYADTIVSDEPIYADMIVSEETKVDATIVSDETKVDVTIVSEETKNDATIVSDESKVYASIVSDESKVDATIVSDESKVDATIVSPKPNLAIRTNKYYTNSFAIGTIKNDDHYYRYEFTVDNLQVKELFVLKDTLDIKCEYVPSSWIVEMAFEKVKADGEVKIPFILKRTDIGHVSVDVIIILEIRDRYGRYLCETPFAGRRCLCEGEEFICDEYELNNYFKDVLKDPFSREAFNRKLQVDLIIKFQMCHVTY